jgi:hypothetical protein
MQPARGMLLDDELVSLCAPGAAARLRGHVELALAVISLQAHFETSQLARTAQDISNNLR